MLHAVKENEESNGMSDHLGGGCRERQSSVDADNDGEGLSSSADDGSDSDTNESEDRKMKPNPAWADAMAKILKTNKPKRKKTIVLAKAKKLKRGSQDKDGEEVVPFEVVDDGVQTKLKAEDEPLMPNKTQINFQLRKLEVEKTKKKLLEMKGRIKPSIADKERERELQKAATKGVIQLFNSVQQQQKSLENEMAKVGPSNNKQDKVLMSMDKTAFLDLLMGAKSQAVPKIKVEPDWAVLKNDFMMSTKLKDWDRDKDDGQK